ncbi:hypothetical protein K458DRAFT_95520 [Lentithecium fluviatile CBS 122367]|uniref:Uncharacterized protein n=1 Tax=Lentithecium fluviatile CBS 122367 TaxID=1168545 RepID=A0A6G1JHA6_9PLEO|nr:hypothetical protein K458DRAFT_95520 [Lentithecium fluviatile CBS 122367]
MATVGEKRPASDLSDSSDEGSFQVKKQKHMVGSTNVGDGTQVTPASDSVASSASSSEDEGQIPEEPPKRRTRAGRKKSEKKSQPPIKTLFETWDYKPKPAPKFNEWWGRKPMPGPEGPKPHPDQPVARTNNAQTIPELWEDRKFRFKKGSRFVQTFRRGEEVPEDTPARLDQQQNLVLNLIDMRPKSRKDPTPRRMATYYIYENGLPKDWDNKQTIKALNDRRQQAIDRITMDPPWTNFEREYLCSLFIDHPDASILEIAERFNWRFMDQDFTKPTGFGGWDYISKGRTTESIRHEYLTYKHKYDVGEVPHKKELADKTPAGKAAGENRMYKFGKRDKAFDNDDSDNSDNSDADDENKTPQKTEPTKAKSIRRISVHVDNFDEEDYDSNSESEEPTFVSSSTRNDQPRLSEGDEELLELAGYNDPQSAVTTPAVDAPSSARYYDDVDVRAEDEGSQADTEDDN